MIRICRQYRQWGQIHTIPLISSSEVTVEAAIPNITVCECFCLMVMVRVGQNIGISPLVSGTDHDPDPDDFYMQFIIQNFTVMLMSSNYHFWQLPTMF